MTICGGRFRHRRLPTPDQFIGQIVGPLAIVEDQQHRAVRRAERVEKAGQRLDRSRLAKGFRPEILPIIAIQNAG